MLNEGCEMMDLANVLYIEIPWALAIRYAASCINFASSYLICGDNWRREERNRVEEYGDV